MLINYERLLHGYYEADSLPRDFTPDRIVPDFGFNVLNTMAPLYAPLVDKHYLDRGGRRPVWPDGKPFAVCLTHDVDAVSLYSSNECYRIRWSQIKGDHSVLKKIKNLLGLGYDWLRYKGQEDPLHCYEFWLKIESEVNARSTFFFWPGIQSIRQIHNTDCRYDLGDTVTFKGQKCTVAEMIKEMDQGMWEIGLHPSWYSFDNIDEMKRQKETLEKVTGHDLFSVRQHYLHYDIRVTPRVHREAGFQYDSTLGFNDNVGFRFGTCYPWFLYDLKNRKEIPVLEIPLIIQDTAMLSPIKGLRLDGYTAFKYITQIANAVEQVGGVLTLLWHADRILEPGWLNLYVQTLQYLKEKNVWFSSIKELGKWWRVMNKG
jgi:hypothetical protein